MKYRAMVVRNLGCRGPAPVIHVSDPLIYICGAEPHLAPLTARPCAGAYWGQERTRLLHKEP